MESFIIPWASVRKSKSDTWLVSRFRESGPVFWGYGSKSVFSLVLSVVREYLLLSSVLFRSYLDWLVHPAVERIHNEIQMKCFNLNSDNSVMIQLVKILRLALRVLQDDINTM